jgi:hypothetical protein
MHVPGRIAPGFTFGAALSNSTRERPSALFPVTTLLIGLISLAMRFLPSALATQHWHWYWYCYRSTVRFSISISASKPSV